MSVVLIQPEDVTVDLADGTQRNFRLHKIPAVQGREIALQYPTSGLPKIGEYAINEAMMLKLMSYVQRVDDEGRGISLTTRDLINNHVPEWEDLVRLEGLMLAYNFSFFRNGKGLTFFAGLEAKLQQSISSILTHLLASLSTKEKQP